MSPQRFRKKPVEIEAVQWTGDNPAALRAFTGMHRIENGGDHFVFTTQSGHGELYVAANGAWLDIEVDEWVIRDARGFYPCKPDIFEQTYDAVVLAESAVPEAPVPDAVHTKRALDSAIQDHARAEWNGDLVVDWVLVAGLAGVNVEHSIGIEESRDSMPAYISNGLLYEALHIDEYDRADDGD